MHIVKQFSTSILVNDSGITFKRIYQVPVPVMKIDSNILSPISDTMFHIEIRCGVISWNFDWNLPFRRILNRSKKKKRKISSKMKFASHEIIQHKIQSLFPRKSTF